MCRRCGAPKDLKGKILLTENAATVPYTSGRHSCVVGLDALQRRIRNQFYQRRPKRIPLSHNRRVCTSVSKAWVCGRLLAGIAGSNPAEGMDVVFCAYMLLSCVGRGLCDGLITRQKESYRVSN
jgi:hypothetical protein